MANPIERPIFFETQILSAADLTASIDHARGQQARHNRYLHLWGIASGLTLTGSEKQTTAGVNYKEITLSTGLAIDGTGREILVPEAETLSEELFDQLNVAIADPDAWYPVFLVGRDQLAAQPTFSMGSCGNSQPKRQVEGFEVIFGRPGDELDLDTQDAPEIADGPGVGGWRVLLGFVQWIAAIKKFKEVADESAGIGRRYAGVQADVIAARGGELTLRTRSANEAGKPAVIIDENEGGSIQFGLLTDQGVVTPVFTVNVKGDVIAEGTISGAVTPGSVQIQSGIATDGIVLPLPPGITEDQVANGQVTLHILLTPLLPGALANDSIEVPFECEVEATTRRVLCRVRSIVFGATSPPNSTDAPGACNYVVLASVPAAAGG
jgi:hypothetical protein